MIDFRLISRAQVKPYAIFWKRVSHSSSFDNEHNGWDSLKVRKLNIFFKDSNPSFSNLLTKEII
jgi:hypothetical protein